MTQHAASPVPSVDLIRRKWEYGRNAPAIRRWTHRMASLSPAEQQLLMIGVALEEGDLPMIEQGGFAYFEPAEHDQRLISTNKGLSDENTSETDARSTSARATPMGSGPTSACPETRTSEANAGTSARQQVVRRYSGVGEVVDEDASQLALFFPQFSPALLDPKLRLWYREGWLQPLSWWPVRFGVRLYYDEEPEALPLVCVSPPPHPKAPHMWLQVRNGVRFRSLCYTFAPDGTIVRGRSREDGAAEVLRQSVMWLLRYLVWSQFGFWPGADVAHDPATIERLTKPDDPCPAHSWRQYGECCRPRILAQLRSQPFSRDGVRAAAHVVNRAG